MTYRVQIDDVVRDATPQEAEKIRFIEAEAAALTARIEALAAAKVSARAKLAALGLSDDEVASLLGA